MNAISKIGNRIIPVFKKHDVIRASIFGSFVSGTAKKTSDIDILIQFKGRKSLLDFVGLKLDLENILGRKVDLVEYPAIHPLLKNRMLKEQVKVL